jgi:ADP-heptose:LPS heptosyltransferase
MNLKQWLRSIWVDHLGQREDRYYWRQQLDGLALPQAGTVCLWMADGKLGDAIVNSMLVKSLRLARPDLSVTLVCSASTAPFWLRLPGISHVVPVGKHWKQTLDTVRQRVSRRFDAFISFETFASSELLQVLKGLNPVAAVGFSVGAYRAFQYSLVDNTYQFPRRHITQRLVNLCDLMGIGFVAESDMVPIVHQGLSRGQGAAKSPRCFFNVYGASEARSFSVSSVSAICQTLSGLIAGLKVEFNVPQGARAEWQGAMPQLGAIQGELAPQGMDLWTLFEHVAQADFVVTTDTAIGHIAAAMGVPCAVFFADRHYNPIVWAPFSTRLEKIMPVVGGASVNDFDEQQLALALQKTAMVASSECI